MLQPNHVNLEDMTLSADARDALPHEQHELARPSARHAGLLRAGAGRQAFAAFDDGQLVLYRENGNSQYAPRLCKSLARTCCK